MKLTDTQCMILSAAAQRARLVALPLPPSLRGGAASKVVTAMLAKGLIAIVPARADEPRWDETDDGSALTLVATDEGLAAIGIEPETAPSTATERATDAPKGKAAPKPRARRKAATAASSASDGAKVPTTRPGTKQGALIAMLRRPEGASIAEISDAFGWQQHTTRGAVSGALRKKLGLDVQSERVEPALELRFRLRRLHRLPQVPRARHRRRLHPRVPGARPRQFDQHGLLRAGADLKLLRLGRDRHRVARGRALLRGGVLCCGASVRRVPGVERDRAVMRVFRPARQERDAWVS